MQEEFVFTSESVSEGHPDKLCDRISDEVVDAFFRYGAEAGWDPRDVRVAFETMATTNRIVIAGETRGPNTITGDFISHIARLAVKDIGYEQDGFHWERVETDVLLHAQSADIARGVDASHEKDEGAGDQGIMFGFACRETPALMPAPIYYAHQILKRLADVRKSGAEPMLGPDSKSQLSVAYVNGKPVRATQIVLSTQHVDPDLDSGDVRAIVEPYIAEVLPEGWIDAATRWHVNPTGKFVTGGPDGDCGLTGRKIIVDTYGGAAPHGGGAFSGKDPTKVDRSAAYVCRYLAKNIVAAGLAERCTIQISYAIGVAEPLSIYLDFHRTGKVKEAEVAAAIRDVVDLTPRGIRERLRLNRPIYARTAAYGHFGREADADGGFTWEKVDLAEELRQAVRPVALAIA